MASTDAPVVLRNLKIWDGDGVADADTLVMQGSVISGVGDTSAIPANATTRDCAGLWAVPGLIDAHVHLELNPDDKNAPSGSQAHQRPLMAQRAAAMVRAGITTARDLGGGAWQELKLRDQIAAGELLGPRLLCSGQPITTPTGHCHFWGGAAANLGEAEAVLDRQVARGVDLIKIMATGGRMTQGSSPSAAQFDVDTVRALVQRADSHGLQVAAHCHGTAGIEVAAAAGVRTIEHCSWVGESGWASDYQEPIAKLILDQGVWVSPTVNRGWQRMLDAPEGKVLGRVRSAYQAMMAMGIPFVASTDAGIPGVYHQDLAHALVVFEQIAELGAERTLQSATRDAAIALGIESVTGALRPGLSADLLLVGASPLESLTTLTEPAAVWAAGRSVR
ncbi:MAG: amidohydrolase family protein [Pseudomonadales bacterium]